MRPPLHPALFFLSQSTSSCSDREISSPVTILFIPSTAATVENAQQLPAHHTSMPITKIHLLTYYFQTRFKAHNWVDPVQIDVLAWPSLTADWAWIEAEICFHTSDSVLSSSLDLAHMTSFKNNNNNNVFFDSGINFYRPTTASKKLRK